MTWGTSPSKDEIFYDAKKGQFYTVNRTNVMGHWLEQGKRTYIGAPYTQQQQAPVVTPPPMLPVAPVQPLAPLGGGTGTAAPPPTLSAGTTPTLGAGNDFWSMLFGGWPRQQVPYNTSTNGATSPTTLHSVFDYATPMKGGQLPKNPPAQGASSQVPKNPPPTGSGIQQTAAPIAAASPAPEVPLRPFG